MAFYLVGQPKCSHHAGCEKKGTHEVRSSGTQSFGFFCKKHALLKVDSLEKVYAKYALTAKENEDLLT